MKFIYGYKTRENEEREGELCASSRDAVYRQLKAKGIRPFKVVLAPGIFNRLQSFGKRWLAIVVLCCLCIVLAVVAGRIASNKSRHSSIDEMVDSPIRRQIVGDAAIIEEGIRSGWASVFELEGDRFLASFAVPGVPAAVRSTTEEEFLKALCADESATARLPPSESESLESRQIRAIVRGMKEEASRFLKAGGSVGAYGKRLAERQDEELGYYNRAKNELEKARETMGRDELRLFWTAQNAKLRRLGIRLLPLGR